MKAIILEDEMLASKRLSRMLAELDPNVEILQSFTSIQETANYYISCAEQPDILFADIHVEDGNSLELFKIVDIRSNIIFTTAYDEYAIQAFRQNATDYLLKPIKKEELKEALDKAKPINQSVIATLETDAYKERFLIRFGAKLHSIKTEDISYIYSRDKISFFFTKNGERIPSDFRLQNLEEMLDPNLFFRANRQFIVHIDAITEIKKHDAARVRLSLNPVIDEEVVVSTERTRIFKQWMQR